MAAPRLKPFIHWAIYKGHKVRYTKHAATRITGILTTEAGAVAFEYDPITQVISLPDGEISINEYGWEIDPDQEGHST